jgi:hypothetical protein
MRARQPERRPWHPLASPCSDGSQRRRERADSDSSRVPLRWLSHQAVRLLSTSERSRGFDPYSPGGSPWLQHRPIGRTLDSGPAAVGRRHRPERGHLGVGRSMRLPRARTRAPLPARSLKPSGRSSARATRRPGPTTCARHEYRPAADPRPTIAVEIRRSRLAAAYRGRVGMLPESAGAAGYPLAIRPSRRK